MKTATKVIILLLATLCIGEIVVSVRLGNQAEEGSLQFNSMGTIRGEGDVELPKIPEGSALQRCRFKCDNLAFLPKDLSRMYLVVFSSLNSLKYFFLPAEAIFSLDFVFFL